MHWGTYWAALVHDYDHKGLNNDFLIRTAHPLAITYSDQSPLENHHIAAATRVFLEPECRYLRVSHLMLYTAPECTMSSTPEVCCALAYLRKMLFALYIDQLTDHTNKCFHVSTRVYGYMSDTQVPMCRMYP